MKSIGEVYFDSSYFRDEESKTIGQALVGPNIETLVKNRRGAKGHLTPEGREILDRIVAKVSEVFGVKVKAVWDRYCGCSMCPCSPGYRIKGDVDYFRSTDETRFGLHVDQKGFVGFHKPSFTWSLGYEKVNKLTETFGNVK